MQTACPYGLQITLAVKLDSRDRREKQLKSKKKKKKLGLVCVFFFFSMVPSTSGLCLRKNVYDVLKVECSNVQGCLVVAVWNTFHSQ